MSDTHDPDDDMPDDPFGVPDDAFRAEADLLMQRWAEFEDKARTLGLYLEGHPQVALVPTPPHGQPQIALIVNLQIGRVAFSDRVQNPPKAEVDDTVRKMDIALKDDQFLDERARIQKAIEQGKDPFEILMGDDEDDDPSTTVE